MGIRIALGARRVDVTWIVLREALLLVLLGVALGVPIAVAVARVTSSQISGLLFGLKATDPLTIAAGRDRDGVWSPRSRRTCPPGEPRASIRW